MKLILNIFNQLNNFILGNIFISLLIGLIILLFGAVILSLANRWYGSTPTIKPKKYTIKAKS